jgi:hypothetical protein
MMTLLSHSMRFSILSPRKFVDVAENLILMTLRTETDLMVHQYVVVFSIKF